MNSELVFNFRHPVVVSVTPQLVALPDGVARQKRQVYEERLGPEANVPAVELDAVRLTRDSEPLRDLAQYVRFTHQSSRVRRVEKYGYLEKGGMLYDMLVQARHNGLYCHYLGAQPDRELAELLYMPRGDDDDTVEDRAQVNATVRVAIVEWARLTTEQLVRSHVSAVLNQQKPRLQWSVSATNWARYYNHCVYEHRESRLQGLRETTWGTGAFRFRLVAVDIDDDDDAFQWETMWAAYLRANPRPPHSELIKESSEVSMLFPPYTEKFLDRLALSLALVDVTGEPVMAGYVVCTLRAVKSATVPRSLTLPLAQPLVQFAHKIAGDARQKQRRADCGYDVFSIDGAHIAPAYRGTRDLFRALMFHPLEFVRQAHRLLGVSVVVADSHAAQTRTILTSLGMQHYNAVTALSWLLMAFEDFLGVVTGSKKPVRTPAKFLQLDGITALLQEYCRAYVDTVAVEASKGYRKAMQRVGEVRAQFVQYRPSAEMTKKLARLLPGVVETLATAKERLEADEDVEALGEAVKKVLASPDADDTHLFLDKGQSDAALFAGSDAFAATFRQSLAQQQPPQAPEEVDLRCVSPVKKEPGAKSPVGSPLKEQPPPQPPKEAHAEEDTPTAEDLALYDAWLQTGKPEVVPLVAPDHGPSATFPLTEEEAAVEAASRQAQEQYIRSLVTELNRKLAPTKLYINLKRNKASK